MKEMIEATSNNFMSGEGTDARAGLKKWERQ
jgi:hypothetical protein